MAGVRLRPPKERAAGEDNLHHKSAAFICWLGARGIMPLYTPLSESWLNMAESLQRILVSRASAGQHPTSPEQLIERLEAGVRGWTQPQPPSSGLVSGRSAGSRRENGVIVWTVPVR